MHEMKITNKLYGFCNFLSSVKGVQSPVRTVVGVGNNLLHHQLCLPQLLLQLGQLEISWRAKKGQSQEKGLRYA